MALLQSTNLVYQGSFRLPASAGYAGNGMWYHQPHNSLFFSRLDVNQVGESTIPTPVDSGGNLGLLPTSTLIQECVDPTEGRLYGSSGIEGNSGSAVNIGGLYVEGNKLYIAAYRYYDANADGILSHIVKTSLTLSSSSNTSGPFQVGAYGAGAVAGYFAAIPSSRQSALGGPVMIGGPTGIPIVTRSSLGPPTFSVTPSQIGVASPYANVTPLSYYPGVHALYDYVNRIGVINTLFNATSRTGGAVVCPNGWDSVLLFGDQGIGPGCYGDGDGSCMDPAKPSKGEHAYPYVFQVWAYDVSDLANAKAGIVNYYDVRPYAQWTLTFPFVTFGAETLPGVAWDEAGGRLFLTQLRAGSDQTAVHVYAIETVTPTPHAGLFINAGLVNGGLVH